MLLLVCGNCQEDVLKASSVAENLASFSGRRTFKSCCSAETRLKLQEVINARNTAFVLFSYIFTGTSFGRWGLLSGLWRAGELCSPHANGMHLSQLRAGVISTHVLFTSALMLSHWLSVYPLSFLQMENSWAKVKFMSKSPTLLSYQGSSCFFWHINSSTEVWLIIKICNLAAY